MAALNDADRPLPLRMYGVTVHNMYIYLRSSAEARDPLLLRLYVSICL